MAYFTSCTNCDYKGNLSFGPMRFVLKHEGLTEEELDIYGSSVSKRWCEQCDDFVSVIEGKAREPYAYEWNTKKIIELEFRIPREKKGSTKRDFAEQLKQCKQDLKEIEMKLARGKEFWDKQNLQPHCTQCKSTNISPLKLDEHDSHRDVKKTNITHKCGGTIVYREGPRLYFGSRTPVTYYDVKGDVVK
jgi:hypothetical protein